jgi:ABC-type molybdate transport system ATPase subunit
MRQAISIEIAAPNGYLMPNHAEEEAMEISARNMIKGRVKQIVHGAVNSEVFIEIQGGGEPVSIITKTSADTL